MTWAEGWKRTALAEQERVKEAKARIAELEMMLRVCMTYLVDQPGLVHDIENVLKDEK